MARFLRAASFAEGSFFQISNSCMTLPDLVLSSLFRKFREICAMWEFFLNFNTIYLACNRLEVPSTRVNNCRAPFFYCCINSALILCYLFMLRHMLKYLPTLWLEDYISL